ncbi:MAG TPA: hypothetical protein VGM13_16510 [Thermoanaerobaculia bacterium]|jgi:hypothetical protein
MPRAVGRDRLAVETPGRVRLDCDAPKGWRPRVRATPTSAEHPGTAVAWEGDFYEVLEVRPGAAGVQYVLAPWDERHAMRVVEAYSEEAEAARTRERADAARRSDRHIGLLLAAPLVGSLPGHVQEFFEREYNIPARRLSLSSALPLWIVGWLALVLLLASAVGGAGAPPLPVLLFGVYLLAESTARLAVCLLQGRAIGTFVGTLAWEAWRRLKAAFGGTPLPVERATWEVESDAAQDVLDRYHVVEPFAGLLPAADQARLSERFDFDGLRWGRVGAIFLIVMFGPLALSSVLGAIAAFEASDILKIAVFGGVVTEQVIRLRALRAGRLAPSVLGVLVRPFARKLLA